MQMRWIQATYLILSLGLVASCRTGSTTSTLDKRISNLEAAVDSLQKENALLHLHISQLESVETKAYLDLEERMVFLENFAAEQEWGLYDRRQK